jgi:hypothetical protein
MVFRKSPPAKIKNQENRKTRKMAVKYPYRAVICGEEHIVQKWRGNTLLTDKGSFCVRHIYGNWRIQDFRIFEVASIQPGPDGKWLVNGIPLERAQFLRGGMRLSDIADDENLRVHKATIRAFARLQATDDAAITSALDAVLEFWKKASLPVVESDEDSLPTSRLFLKALESLSDATAIPLLFKGWSKPIWLTEFHPTGHKPALSKEQKQLATVSAQLEQTAAQLRKAEEAATDTLKEALEKWMEFDPPRMSADTKARIEKAVRLYMTVSEKRSLSKIATEFKVTPKTVSLWFKAFTDETGFRVVSYKQHVSVKDQLETDAGVNEGRMTPRYRNTG